MPHPRSLTGVLRFASPDHATTDSDRPLQARRSPARRLLAGRSPRDVVATAGRFFAAGIMPSLCFLIGRHAFGLVGAIGVSLAWGLGYQVLLHRLRHRWSTLVTMYLAEMLLRSIVSLCLDSTTAYFVIPSLVTMVFGATYVISYVIDRPLLALIARDILPSSWVESHPRRVSLLRVASVAYGSEQILVAALSILLAIHLSPSAYVEVHPPVSWATLGAAGLIYWLVCCRPGPRRPFCRPLRLPRWTRHQVGLAGLDG